MFYSSEQRQLLIYPISMEYMKHKRAILDWLSNTPVAIISAQQNSDVLLHPAFSWFSSGDEGE